MEIIRKFTCLKQDIDKDIAGGGRGWRLSPENS